jgi:uncharacterized membrane protein SirB2
MEQFYLPIKHIHLSLVAFSVLFFIMRVGLMFAGRGIHQLKWAKLTSRIVDTLLLVSALTLCFIINQYPFVDGWISEKVISVIVYIILAYVALYRAKTIKSKLLSTIGALGWVVIAAKLAFFKQAFILG